MASPWMNAKVLSLRDETPTAKTLRLELPAPVPHLAGQHFIVRLTAPDGYIAQRSYSVATAPDDTAEIELTVERLPEGEVSVYLHDVLEVGDDLEVRGPIGGYFVWPGNEPALLVGGGSGIVPLMAMLRLARREQRADLLRLVVSVRGPEQLYYKDEVAGPESTIVYTRTAPAGTERSPGRLRAEDLQPLLRGEETAYICGSPAFADTAGDLLVELGVPASRIRVERFGPTG